MVYLQHLNENQMKQQKSPIDIFKESILMHRQMIKSYEQSIRLYKQSQQSQKNTLSVPKINKNIMAGFPKRIEVDSYPLLAPSIYKKLIFAENLHPDKIYSVDELFRVLAPFEYKLRLLPKLNKRLFYYEKEFNRDKEEFIKFYGVDFEGWKKHLIKEEKIHLSNFKDDIGRNLKVYVSQGKLLTFKIGKISYYTTKIKSFKKAIKNIY